MILNFRVIFLFFLFRLSFVFTYDIIFLGVDFLPYDR